MHHGNATFRRWFRLLVLLLAVLPSLAEAAVMYSGTLRCQFYLDETGNSGHPGYVSAQPGKGLMGVADMSFAYEREASTMNNYKFRVTAFVVKDVVTGTVYRRAVSLVGRTFTGTVGGGTGPLGGVDTANAFPLAWASWGEPFGKSVQISIADRTYAAGDVPLALFRLDEAGAINLSPFNSGRINVKTTIRNNTLAPVTVTVDGRQHGVNVLSSETWTEDIEGPIGNTVEIGSFDTIVWKEAYDPILIVAVEDPLREYVREGRVGSPIAVHKVHIEAINYSEIRAVLVGCKVVGWDTAIGTIPLPIYSGQGLPPWQTIDVNLELPPGSRLAFAANPGDYVRCEVTSEQVVQATDLTPAELRYYVSVYETAADNPPSVTSAVDPSSGSQWLGVTDNTGTTSIGTSTVNDPTNTNTTPTGAIDSVTGGATGSGGSVTTGTTYGNTSSGMASAATQAMAADLGAIRDDADRLRKNSDAERKDREDNLPENRKAAVNQVLGEYSNPSAKAAEAVSEATNRGETMKTVATAAVAASIGTASTTALDAPAVPADETVTLDIGPGKQITVHLNPFSPDGPLGGVILMAATFIKRLIAWAIVALFFYSTLKEVRHVCGGAFPTNSYHSQVADMVKSISIFGWSVGVPIGIVLRIAIVALIVTLVLTMPPAIFAALEAGLPWSSLKEVYQAGPPGAGSSSGAGSMLVKAIGYADYVLPWRLMLSMPLYYILVQYVLFPLQMFWQMVFKFLP